MRQQDSTFGTTFSWASGFFFTSTILHTNSDSSYREELDQITYIMDVDESNKQKLKDDYSSGLISIDEYTEGLVRLVVSFCFGFDLCCAKLMCLISHTTV
jgi:hypothetical protein